MAEQSYKNFRGDAHLFIFISKVRVKGPLAAIYMYMTKSSKSFWKKKQNKKTMSMIFENYGRRVQSIAMLDALDLEKV